jgi:2-oxoglutarate ferredoxin oxidoreductase subunit alpha
MAQNSNPEKIVNDFCITISTINGSGSATANTTLLRSIFRMGIPVSGKNIFPSNIQGQPTWYSIRVSRDGYTARLEKDDIVVAMNPATIEKELTYLLPGGVLFYADDIQLPAIPAEIIMYPMPVKALVKESDVTPNLRSYIANMVYVGVLAQVIGIRLEEIRAALDFHFKDKQKAIDSNFVIVQKAADWAKENIKKSDRYFIEPMDETKECIMADGNTAGAIGSLFGGLQFSAWYPITPASELPETLNEYIPLLRKDPETGKTTCIVVQAEDELAAIGMTIGAGWAGLRSMTATSGPGLSLMTEYLGLAYFTEVPIVVWDVQRVGPSTGLPTRTAQGDITSAYYMSQGDTEYVILFPGSVYECFEFGWKALDIAEHLQSPVIVMIDLDLGMNQWMTTKFQYPDRPMDRGKILWEDDLEKLIQKNSQYGRYLDVDGDGIPYRTVPGNKHTKSGYFTRGTGHDEFARYSEDPAIWERVMNRLADKIYKNKNILPEPEIQNTPGASIGIIGFGSTNPAIEEAKDELEGKGIKADYLRIRSIPFLDSIEDFIKKHSRTYVIELNRDGQMHQLLTSNYPELAHNLIHLSHADGLPMSAKWITSHIEEKEQR